MQLPNPCTLCPRACRADRAHGQRGFCGADGTLRVARAALHHWEEPCLSGDPNAATGSGTVFFSNCALRCCYCQNYPISQGDVGKEITVERLTEIFLALQKSGAKNLNLVTATQYLPWALPALDAARAAGFALPVVYNTGGYETLETVKALAGYVDIWLADVKYASPDLAAELSAARDYPAVAEAALRQMLRQAGAPVYDADGYLQKGVIVRHLALPGHTDDSFAVLALLARIRDEEGVPFIPSLMSQFTPFYKAAEHNLGRRITTYEYRKVIDEAATCRRKAVRGKNTPRPLTWRACDAYRYRVSGAVFGRRAAAGTVGRARRLPCRGGPARVRVLCFVAGGAARRVRAGVRLHAAGRLACGCRGRPALRGIDFCRARTYPFC